MNDQYKRLFGVDHPIQTEDDYRREFGVPPWQWRSPDFPNNTPAQMKAAMEAEIRELRILVDEQEDLIRYGGN